MPKGNLLSNNVFYDFKYNNDKIFLMSKHYKSADGLGENTRKYHDVSEFHVEGSSQFVIYNMLTCKSPHLQSKCIDIFVFKVNAHRSMSPKVLKNVKLSGMP